MYRFFQNIFFLLLSKRQVEYLIEKDRCSRPSNRMKQIHAWRAGKGPFAELERDPILNAFQDLFSEGGSARNRSICNKMSNKIETGKYLRTRNGKEWTIFGSRVNGKEKVQSRRRSRSTNIEPLRISGICFRFFRCTVSLRVPR